ncbi:hypothetical protein WK00_19515 [Burkholderia ubonensis]|nr:hypothetical protein WK00_19515 [Burkholderia ubonensis]KWI17158.1 hypothetical protein WM01_01180 [Burkholderia ubonensis]OJA96736.1 hypothetical protein BGV51_25410 [Burkholderia ubonensis]
MRRHGLDEARPDNRRTRAMELKGGGADKRRAGFAVATRQVARGPEPVAPAPVASNRFDATGHRKQGRIAARQGQRLWSGPEGMAGDARQWRRGMRFLPEIPRVAGFYQADARRYPKIEFLR